MIRARMALLGFFLATLAVWGCAQGPANGNGNADKVKNLESKCTKLEDENKAITAARDQLRKRLAEAEEQRAKVQRDVEQLQAAVKERDDLRQQLTARTGERDALQGQFEQLRKGIRGLLTQAETMAATPAQPATAAALERGPDSF